MVILGFYRTDVIMVGFYRSPMVVLGCFRSTMVVLECYSITMLIVGPRGPTLGGWVLQEHQGGWGAGKKLKTTIIW